MEPKKSANKNKSPKGFIIYWLYAVYFSFLLVTYFLNPMPGSEEISGLQFE